MIVAEKRKNKKIMKSSTPRTPPPPPSTTVAAVAPTAMAAFPFRSHSITAAFLLFIGCCNYFSTTLAEGWLSHVCRECFMVGLAWHIFTLLMCLFKNKPWLLSSAFFFFQPFVAAYRRILGPSVFSSPLRKYPRMMEYVALLGFSFFWLHLIIPGPEYWRFCRTFQCDVAYSYYQHFQMLGYACAFPFVSLAKIKVAEPRTTAEASTISEKLKGSGTLLIEGGLLMKLAVITICSARVSFLVRPVADAIWIGGIILRVVSSR